jgi:hypothetical protein
MTRSNYEEQTASITVSALTDTNHSDGEDRLYEALDALHDYRYTRDRDRLHDAEIAVMQAYFAIHNEIENTAP